MFSYFFFCENGVVYEICGKMRYSCKGHNDSVVHALCMPHNWGYRPKLRICSTYYFSTATMVARTCLSFMLYLHSFSLGVWGRGVVAQIELGRLVLRSLSRTHAHTPGRTPQRKWSARRRGRYIHNTHNKHKRRSSMTSAGFELAMPSTKRLHTHA